MHNFNRGNEVSSSLQKFRKKPNNTFKSHVSPADKHLDMPRQVKTPAKSPAKRRAEARTKAVTTAHKYERKSAGYKSPGAASAKSDNDESKFGFSTLQYKKLQVIKSVRGLNMKVFLEATRTLPNKFYTTVLKALLHLLRTVRGTSLHEEEELIDDHESAVEFIKDRHYILLQDAGKLPVMLESQPESRSAEVFEQRQLYFHKFKQEKDLYKYCLKSKEIKAFLQVIFAAYAYCEEASRPTKSQPASPVKARRTKKGMSVTEQKPKTKREGIPYPEVDMFARPQQNRDEI